MGGLNVGSACRPAIGDDRGAATPPLALRGTSIAVSVRGVRKRFGRVVALDDVDLDVRRGEVLGLLGRNGAGKTTLLHLLAGVGVPDAGTVRVGADAGDPASAAARRAIGLAPQSLALYPELTAVENVRFFARLQGLRSAALTEAVAAALAAAGLEARATDRAKTLSGGMKRRLNLACAVVHRPSVLLLDEPTAGVDPGSRDRLLESIRAFAETGITVIYSTHLMEEVEVVCERIALLGAGRLLAIGTLRELLLRHDAKDLRSLFATLTVDEAGE